MVNADARAAAKTLRKMAWSVRVARDGRPLPSHIDKRYPGIPPSVRWFLEHLQEGVRSDEQVYFLTTEDYSAEAGEGIRWDEWERIECEDGEVDEVRAFWNAHLPILHSVAGDYAYLAVCVDPASTDYGKVVRGDAPDFRETVPVCDSFDELLDQIAGMQEESVPDALADLFLDPHDDRMLVSTGDPKGVWGKIANYFRGWPLFESYRIAVVVEPVLSRPLWKWENWSKIIPPMNAVTKGVGAEAVIRPRVAGDHDNWLPFGRLPWNEKSNRTWTARCIGSPPGEGPVEFFATEIWAPSRAISFETRRGPELFCLIDRNSADGTQGFVLAVRRDVLGRVDIAADAVVFAVREVLDNAACLVFERRWGEYGRFGSTIVAEGLDRTNSATVLQWAKEHRRAHVLSFRWRRWMCG